MADLTTLANVKAWLNLTSTDADALLERLITATSGVIEQYVNRTLLTHDVVEELDGTGGTKLAFREYPVTAVTSVTVDGTVIPAAAGPLDLGYVVGRYSIKLRGYTFNEGYSNVSIEYTAGYAEVPPDVEQACIAYVSFLYKDRDRIGISSKGLAGEQTTFSQKDMPAFVKQALSSYRRVITP